MPPIKEYKLVPEERPEFIVYGDVLTTVYLFESPIDALSYLDIYENPYGALVSTNGEMMVSKVINFVSEHGVKTVFTCFDNDAKGDQFHNIIKEEMLGKKLNFKLIRKKPNNFFKDWNEYLVDSKIKK